ncbi:MAG: hypothetical protein HWD61_00085 [Parachlamydiaceae bacterium]|nr:MAG: hypothetical protein HWD61_00085 [Parachlamydiaceae bacterium]
MNIPALNPAAELYLNILKIEDSEKDKIRSCISRYTRSKSCSGTLKWMIYRIKNAIKSIFGKSDWQATKKSF